MSQNTYLQLFKNRDFVALWSGQLVSFLGDYFEWLAIPILVQRLTGSTFMIGLWMISTSIPAMVLGPVAGVFVDRWDRKTTMIVSDVIRAILVLFCLLVQRGDQVWIFYGVGFLVASASRFFFPARNATLPLIVTDEKNLLAANGLMQVIQTVGMLAGPALAGVMIGLWGASVAFIVHSLTYWISALAILLMRVPHTTPGNLQLLQVWGDLKEGVVYLFNSRVLVSVLICLGVVMLGFGAINVLWVPYLTITFGVGAAGIGLVDSMMGLGMVLGGVALGAMSTRFRPALVAGWGIIVMGVMVGCMGLASSYYLILVLSFIMGLVLVPVNSILATIMQLAVPDIKRGRVSGAMDAVVTGASMISMGIAAWAADLVGFRPIYLTCAVITILAGVLGVQLLEVRKPESSEVMEIP